MPRQADIDAFREAQTHSHRFARLTYEIEKCSCGALRRTLTQEDTPWLRGCGH